MGVREHAKDVVSLPMSNLVTHVMINIRRRGHGEEDACAGSAVASSVPICLPTWKGVKTEGEAGRR